MVYKPNVPDLEPLQLVPQGLQSTQQYFIVAVRGNSQQVCSQSGELLYEKIVLHQPRIELRTINGALLAGFQERVLDGQTPSMLMLTQTGFT